MNQQLSIFNKTFVQDLGRNETTKIAQDLAESVDEPYFNAKGQHLPWETCGTCLDCGEEKE